MIRRQSAWALSLAIPVALPAGVLAQDKPAGMTPGQQATMDAYRRAGTPGPQHAQLARAAGTWDLVIRSWNEPGKPPRVEHGTAERHMTLDGRVMVENVQSTMMGRPFAGMGMTGYDNVSGKHWSTWNDNMSTGLMVSEGDCDARNACTFRGSWNDPIAKGRINARMTTRWTAPDTQVFEMYGPGPGGREMKMMEITYTRAKS